MNKKLLPIVIVLVLLIIGAGAYFAMKKSPSSPETMQKAQTENKAAMLQGTLKSLLTQGRSITCTYSGGTQANSVSGTVYVSGGKMRGDFTSKGGPSTVNSHMIIDSSYSYIWSDMSNQGFKMALTGETTNPSPNPENNTPNINQSYNYSCQPWNGDNSKFTLPATITFQSFALPTIMPSSAIGIPTSGGTSVSGQCSVCDSIPAGTGRDACRTQLHCQ